MAVRHRRTAASGGMVVVKRALLSCSDKAGLDVFANALAAQGVELVASGGTAEFLATHGLRVVSVEQFAGITEQLDGRVKTLHPKIYAGILARRDNPQHVASVGAAGLIDLVIVNLYPFERTIQQPTVSLTDAIEQIDIGGVALLRAAAKNFAHIAVVSSPQQYQAVAEALAKGRGQLPDALAHELAVSAFALTSAYDTAITGFLSCRDGASAQPGTSELPERTTIRVRKRQPLRYGENPHQTGAWYASDAGAPEGLARLTQEQGKELSYNNLLDIDAALRCLLEFRDPACVIIKHGSQCGLAVDAAILDAYDRAYACDSESAFGGIVGVNRPVDEWLAQRLTATFLEVVLAPSVDSSAKPLLAKKPNLRVVTLPWPASVPGGLEWRQLFGGWLSQSADAASVNAQTLKVVTQRAPTDRERADLLFAWAAAKHVKSNGIVIASGGATVGIGQGQPSRVGSVRLAIQKAGQRARDTVAASDGFFPFPDGVELLAQAGVTAVIQPGGSIRDPEVIAAADRANLAMLLTGIRHFRH